MEKSKLKFEEIYNSIVSNKKRNPINSKLEETVFSVFNDAINQLENKQDFRLIKNQWFRTSSHHPFEIDILLIYKESPLAIIEVKQDLRYFRPELRNKFSHYCKVLNAQYCFVCSGASFDLFENTDILNKISDDAELSAYNISRIIKDKVIHDETKFEQLTNQQVIDHLIDIISNSQVDNGIKPKLKEIISKATPCSLENGSYFIDQALERKFFIQLLGSTPSQICRYTSLSSIFRTINDKEQSMCSIVCMNDKSEIEYAAKKIGYVTPFSHNDANNCYILSCAYTSKRDNLTMWRLYGDDGKGVYILYEVDENSSNAFAIAPISYADSYGFDPKLELVRGLLASFKGAKLELSEWNIWQHFFKPYEYNDESEIRLLFWDECTPNEDDQNEDDQNEDDQNNEAAEIHPEFKRKWILESNYGVIAPIVCFNIASSSSEFPLKIKEIMIGPKNKEKVQNCKQLLQMSIAKGICKLSDKEFTSISGINHYR